MPVVSETKIEIGARAIAVSQGYEPDDLAPIGVMCTGDNKPVPWWNVFAEQSEACLTAALSDQVASVEQFISDMADSANEVKATEKQKEIFKATLRFAISHARRKEAQRKAAPPSSPAAGE